MDEQKQWYFGTVRQAYWCIHTCTHTHACADAHTYTHARAHACNTNFHTFRVCTHVFIRASVPFAGDVCFHRQDDPASCGSVGGPADRGGLSGCLPGQLPSSSFSGNAV